MQATRNLLIAHRAEACAFCKGDGRCAKCGGAGHRTTKRGVFQRRVLVPCVACDGTGVCGLCKGTSARS